jgi:L-aspartate oxidase
MGGVCVDQNGHTTKKGLWACGEVSATGVHGANRLASNSLLEGLVFGARVSQNIVEVSDFNEDLHQTDTATPHIPTFITDDETADANLLRQTMWDDVGLVRSEESMTRALNTFDDIRHRHAGSMMLRNMVDAATMITQAAKERKESRGGHYRSDYPLHSDTPEHHPFVFTGNGPWM